MSRDSERIQELEQRVLKLEQALHEPDIFLEKAPAEPEVSPAQLRENGHPYCPVCLTFGATHRKTCPHRNEGMDKHVKKVKV